MLRGLYVGCPIWSRKDWVGELFAPGTPPGQYLAQYASVFNTVEGNTTFYSVPRAETVAKWRDQTPPGFRFCFKFPRSITHDRRLLQVERLVADFIGAIEALGDRLGPVFLQLPPTWEPRSLPDLDRVLGMLTPSLRYAVEVRHPGFAGAAGSELDALLRGRGVDRVVFDARGLFSARGDDPDLLEAQRRKPRLPPAYSATSRHPFVRFIGHPSPDHNVSLLGDLAVRVAAWIRADLEPFVFMHSPNDFYAPRLCRLFVDLLSREIDVGHLPPWPAQVGTPGRGGGQMSLF